MGKYFGTDGFRGEANVKLKAEDAFKTGRFLGWYYAANHHDGEKVRILIGKDTRLSSDMFENALSAGINASGADCFLMGVTTTPSVAFIARREGFDCAVMISASHNPFYDNGLKVINGDGEKFDDEAIARIEEYFDGGLGELPYATRENVGMTIGYNEARKTYADFLLGIAEEAGMKPFAGHRIAVDCANGSAAVYAKHIFNTLGAEVSIMADDPDGLNINEGVGSTHMDALKKFVVETGSEIGFAYDGDADRCLAVDEHGSEINGDKIMYACAGMLREAGGLKDDTVVVTVMSNIGLIKAFDKAGFRYEKTKVGDRFVYECMKEHGYTLGGEQSGHIIFTEYATTGDGILTSLKLMGALIKAGCTASELVKDCVMYPQYMKNVRVSDKAAALADPEMAAEITKAEAELAGDGRILVRESGTEPVIRVMAEAATMEICTAVVDRISAVVEKNNS